MNTAIRPAEERDRLLIKNLFNLYQNEFAAYTDEFGFPDGDGYFAPDTVNEVLPYGDGVYPYIILLDGKNAGFLLVTDSRYADGCDWRFEEIYLVHAARGKGAAKAAALLAMRGRPGRWRLSVYEENARARAFWRAVAKAAGAEIAREESQYPGMADFVFAPRADFGTASAP